MRLLKLGAGHRDGISRLSCLRRGLPGCHSDATHRCRAACPQDRRRRGCYGPSSRPPNLQLSSPSQGTSVAGYPQRYRPSNHRSRTRARTQLLARFRTRLPAGGSRIRTLGPSSLVLVLSHLGKAGKSERGGPEALSLSQGIEGSNPLPSSGKSGANRTSELLGSLPGAAFDAAVRSFRSTVSFSRRGWGNIPVADAIHEPKASRPSSATPSCKTGRATPVARAPQCAAALPPVPCRKSTITRRTSRNHSPLDRRQPRLRHSDKARSPHPKPALLSDLGEDCRCGISV